MLKTILPSMQTRLDSPHRRVATLDSVGVGVLLVEAKPI